jgi:hypothetical protein
MFACLRLRYGHALKCECEVSGMMLSELRLESYRSWCKGSWLLAGQLVRGDWIGGASKGTGVRRPIQAREQVCGVPGVAQDPTPLKHRPVHKQLGQKQDCAL